jgi:L-alanine-DL-glutamate epimerase-like enolase superfamily enzyme
MNGLRITDIVIAESTGMLRLLTDSDHEGCCPGVPPTSAETIRELYSPLLVGAGPRERERLWHAMVARTADQELEEPLWAYVDVALWDLLGKVLQLPVYQVLGGFRDRVPASGHSGSGLADDEVIEAAVAAAAAGCWAYIDAVPRPVEATSDLALRLRQAVGPDFRLIHHGNGRHTHQEALRLGRGLEAASYHRLENPLPATDLPGLESLTANLDLPVYSMNSGPDACRLAAQLLARNATDGMIVSVPASGGITDVIKLARTAECFGVNCELGVDRTMGGYVHAQLLGAIRNAHFFATGEAGEDASAPSIEPLRPVDGHVPVPTTPGLGLQEQD